MPRRVTTTSRASGQRLTGQPPLQQPQRAPPTARAASASPPAGAGAPITARTTSGAARPGQRPLQGGQVRVPLSAARRHRPPRIAIWRGTRPRSAAVTGRQPTVNSDPLPGRRRRRAGPGPPAGRRCARWRSGRRRSPATSTRSADSPAGLIRTRAWAAPACPSRTPDQENGSSTGDCSSLPSSAPCRAASSSAGWITKPWAAAAWSSGQRDLGVHALAVPPGRGSPWNAGPYSYPAAASRAYSSVDRDRFGARWRPGRRGQRRGRAGPSVCGQGAARVAGHLARLVVRPPSSGQV